MFEAADTNFALRRRIMNRVVISLFVLMSVIGAFEFGKFWTVKDQFEPTAHFSWTGFCSSMGGDQTLCACMEREMIKDFGRDPSKSKNTDQTIIDRAFKTCKP